MPFEHRIDRCFADGITSAAVEALRAQTAAGIDGLRAAQRDNSLPLLNLPERDDDLAALTAVARDCRERFDDVVVLGIGGSSPGGKKVVGLADRGFGPLQGANGRAPRLHFMDNIDPVSFADLEAPTDPTRTVVIVIAE